MFKKNTLIVTALLLVSILGIIVLVLIGIGRAYRGGISNVAETLPQQYKLEKKKEVRRITIKASDEAGCIEVTPDGIVRVYAQCGGALQSAIRLTDTKSLLQLFRLVSENDLTKLKKGKGKVYQLTIETDSGTQTITIVGGGDGTPIIQTIETIINNLPTTSPSPAASGITPSPTIIPGVPTPTPGTGGDASSDPSPSPDAAVTPNPFTCNFSESGGTKPVRVSNVVCTSEPLPGQ